jgi:glycosyltransferase involved in cell wall biosynthesis
MTPAAIDVLIPVYNGATWLRRSIDSIRRQTHVDLCIHVVDDGSTDATPAILATLAASDGRIRIHRKSNGGIVDALNHGLRHCRAEWIARHDADDVAHPQRLRRQLAYLREHPDCVAVSAMARHIDEHGSALGTVTELRPPGEADPCWIPAREPYLMHPLLMVRRSALQAVGGYRSVLHAEDSDLYWRLSALGRLHNLSEVLGDYRLHGSSVSSGSVHNGRLMSVSSQLAAVSARRRRDARPDLDFDPAWGATLRKASSLREMLDQAGARLDAAERRAFELAVAAKLLELSAYLPYEPDSADCHCVRAAWRRGRAEARSPENRRALAAQLTRTAVRLARAGRMADVRRLLPRRMWPEFALRYALLAWLPDALRARLRPLREALRRLLLRHRRALP